MSWDRRFLALAQHVSTWSKDPSTQVGAVIVRPHNTIASIGFNGLPRGVTDTSERLNNRELKYKLVVHAEENAILHAREPLLNYTLYTWPFQPCSHCAAVIIQSGIGRVVSLPPTPPADARWAENFALARAMLAEAYVIVDLLPDLRAA